MTRVKTTKEKAGVVRQNNENEFPVVVIGGSAGAFNSLLTLLRDLPENLPAAICIVLHITPNANVSFLIQHLQHSTKLKCKLAIDGEKLKKHTIYLAIPGSHMLLKKDTILFGNGPDVNRFKPSIDLLFRAAAVNLRERVIGIILSGLLDDGVAGLIAIHDCGGTSIVQDPSDAEYADLPIAAIETNRPDYTLPVSAMSGQLVKLCSRKRKKIAKIPHELIKEVEITEKMLSDIDHTRALGTQSLFTCPDCGGVMFTIEEHGLKRFKCFTGHIHTEKGLLEKQNETLLLTLWTAIRMFEERKKLLTSLPETGSIKKRRSELDEHIKLLKKLLTDMQRITRQP